MNKIGQQCLGALPFGLATAMLATFAACQPASNNDTNASSSSSSSSSSGGPDGSVEGSVTEDGGASSGEPAKPFHAVTGAKDDERVTGVYCPSAASGCVVSTTGSSTPAHLYAIDATSVKPTPLFTSDDALSTTAGIVGTVEFLGFSKVGNSLIARLDKGGKAFLSATNDPLQAGSWTAVSMGTVTNGDFALNAQYGFGIKDTTFIQLRNSFVYTAPATPAPGTTWTTVWSPGGVGQVPANLNELRQADPTLCSSGVSYSAAPRPTQAAYVAADGAIVLYPANALNQESSDASGVCISTDGGNRFHLAKLTPLGADLNGPTALHCTTKDHCVVAGGQVFVDNSAYVFVSNNASMGATSTWTAATLPTSLKSGQTLPNEIVFAPDGKHGWIVGNSDNKPMLWSTTDGGANWKDDSLSISTLTDARLWSGYAVDATHIVIAGEKGTILSTF